MLLDIKLRRRFDPAPVPTITNKDISVQVTGTEGNTFLELKIPIHSVGHSTGNDGDFRQIDVPKSLKVFFNEIIFSPVVLAAAATSSDDNTDNIQIDIRLVVEGKKPWEGA